MLNAQARKDLNTRSAIGDKMIGLLRRAPGLELLTFTQGLNEHETRVSTKDTGEGVAAAVADGYEFSGIDARTDQLVFKKLAGLFYPVPGYFVGGFPMYLAG